MRKKFITKKSEALYTELKKYLLDGVGSSFHKAKEELYPISFSHGKGCYLYDVDGNKYIDYINGLGPMILGYSPDVLNEHTIAQIQKGTHFSAPGEGLLDLAKKISAIIPCAERISFQSSGTEANLFAFRVARAFTKKKKIIKFEGQYHGWADEQKISIDANSLEEMGERTNPTKIIHNPGQPKTSTENIIVLPWNDAELLEKTLEASLKSVFNGSDHDIAAVIMEPFMCDSGPILPQKEYLFRVREITKKYNVLLIFDEVITGFHMALGGAQEYYGVIPDLATFGKAVAGGYPIAFIAGRKEVMECGVSSSGTFNANALSVAAANATIEELSKPKLYEHFDKLGTLFCSGLQDLSKKYGFPIFCDHLGAICMVLFGVRKSPEDFRDCVEKIDYEFYDKVVQSAKSYGVRFTAKRGRLYLTTAHTEADIKETLDVLDLVFLELLSDRTDNTFTQETT